MRFAPGALNAAMQWVYKEFGANWTDDQDCDDYGVLTEQAIEIRAYLKSHFSELKEAQIKDLLDSKIWINQKQILLKARQLQQAIGTAQHDDMNDFEATLKAACKTQTVTLDTKEKKQITDAVSWKNPAAEKVIKKIHTGKANPLYGLFALGGKVIEYQADTELRDNENVALDPSQAVNALNEAYFIKEVQPPRELIDIDADLDKVSAEIMQLLQEVHS